MDSSEQASVYPRGASAVSLHERFSKILLEQQAHSRLAAFNPVLPWQRRASSPSDVILLMMAPQPQAPVSSQRAGYQRLRRRSVWTRLGWRRVTRRLSASRPRGFWSFRKKYKWRSQLTSTCRRSLCAPLGRRRRLRMAKVHKLTAGRRGLTQTVQKGGATTLKARGRTREEVLTKKQLDAELEEYMSLSKRRLDKQLDDYMSMSRSHLDAKLDEYMLMAGQPPLLWN